MDAARFAKVYGADGPFVTVYLDVPAAVEDAAARLDVAWKNIARELAERDVDPATIDALDAARSRGAIGGPTRVLVAAHGQALLDLWLPDPPLGESVHVGPLPHLLPAIGSISAHIPHLVVLVDRLGADVLAYTVGREPVVETSTGDITPWPVHKTGTGGWSAQRYEHSVQESWERGAKDVAALVDRVAREIDPRLVIGCGDQQALTLLRDHLPQALVERFVEVPGSGRHADGGEEQVRRRIDDAVAERVARDDVELLERFGEAIGREEGARQGVARVVEALQRAEVDTLIVTESFADADRQLPFGREPLQLATDPGELAAMNVTEPQQAPAGDVLVRAALCSDAAVTVVADGAEHAPAEGVGALLRFDLRGQVNQPDAGEAG